jgi:hypothetical protein
MSEILVRMKVDVWKDTRPEISWVPVSRRTAKCVYYSVLVRRPDGKAVRSERLFSAIRLERVENGKKGQAIPGVKVIRWIQDDREPIQGGMQYNMALFNVLEVVNAEMRRAAVNVNDMETLLDGALEEGTGGSLAALGMTGKTLGMTGSGAGMARAAEENN